MFSSVVASPLEAEEQHSNNIGKLRPIEVDPILDLDSIGTVVQDLQSLRVYCFPKPSRCLSVSLSANGPMGVIYLAGPPPMGVIYPAGPLPMVVNRLSGIPMPRN